MQTVVISSRVDASVAARVKEEAQAAGINIGAYLERAVRAHLADADAGALAKAEVSLGKVPVVDDLLAANQILMDQIDKIAATLDQLVTLFRNQG